MSHAVISRFSARGDWARRSSSIEIEGRNGRRLRWSDCLDEPQQLFRNRLEGNIVVQRMESAAQPGVQSGMNRSELFAARSRVLGRVRRRFEMVRPIPYQHDEPPNDPDQGAKIRPGPAWSVGSLDWLSGRERYQH